MSEKEKGNALVPLDSYLIGGAYVRTYLITQASDLFEALKRLCDLGFVEHAVMIISNILSANARGAIRMMPFQLEEFPVKCLCIDELDTGNYYVFIKTMIPGDPATEEIYCYAFDIIVDKSGNKNVVLRVCSYTEYRSYYDMVKKMLSKATAVDYEGLVKKYGSGKEVEEIDIDRLLVSVESKRRKRK